MTEQDDDAPTLVSGIRVYTICPIYAGQQKRQEHNLTRLPAGVLGTIKNIEKGNWSMPVCLLRIEYRGRRYWAQVAPTVLREETL